MPRVLGLDVSANRIAWALCDGVGTCETDIFRRDVIDPMAFVERAARDILIRLQSAVGLRPDACCLEINLRPDIMHKGRVSPQKIAAYMRSRWVEGALLFACGLTEPQMIMKIKGGFHKIPAGNVFALQASGGKDAKQVRRDRMTLIYKLPKDLSEDECDALAVSHECCVALTTGVRSEYSFDMLAKSPDAAAPGSDIRLPSSSSLP